MAESTPSNLAQISEQISGKEGDLNFVNNS